MTHAYKANGLRLLEEGIWVTNPRTGVKCLTIPNVITEYDVGKGEFPIATTRKGLWLSPIAEFIGYMNGFDDAQAFADLGSPTWFGNANRNKSWLNNPNRKGDNDMGMVYGAIGNNYPVVDSSGQVTHTIDLLRKVYNNLKQGIDDRGEIYTFWMPGMFEMGCLRPCMHTHQFTLIGGTLHLTSVQRSCDAPLGTRANAVQCYFFLAVMAHLTGHKPGKVTHMQVNYHLYEDQYELFKGEMSRPVLDNPDLKFTISDELKTLEQLRVIKTPEDIKSYFNLSGYDNHHDPISYPFTA